MDTEDKLLNFLQYKAFTADERKKFVYNNNPPSKTIKKWNELILKNKEYPNPNAVNNTSNDINNTSNAVINVEEGQFDIINTDTIASLTTNTNPFINRAVSFIAELEKSKSKKSKAVVFDTTGEPQPTFDIPKEWGYNTKEQETQIENTMDIYSYPSLELQREQQALTETLTELTKAREEVNEARATAIKIIAEATANADAELQITQAQAQSEAREIIAKARREADEIINDAISIKDGIEGQRQAILSQVRATAEQKAQEIIKDGYDAQQSLIKRGGEQGEEIEKNVIAEANKYYLKKKAEADEYYKQKITEADAYKPSPVINTKKNDCKYVFDDVEGLYQFVLSGDYIVDVDRHNEKLFTIQEIVNGEAENPLFRIKL